VAEDKKLMWGGLCPRLKPTVGKKVIFLKPGGERKKCLCGMLEGLSGVQIWSRKPGNTGRSMQRGMVEGQC